MMNRLRVTGLLGLTAMWAAGQTLVDGRRSVVLDGQAAQVVVDLAGGSITDFHLADQGLDPLVWNDAGDVNEARPMAHFLCLDRWGQPSEAEARNGMPFHGEATRVEWKLLSGPSKQSGRIEAAMSAFLPLAGLEVHRTIRLSEKEAFLTVTETVINKNKLGRVYNMVQHPTIGPPFLDETTVVDANARKGLMQDSPLPNPEEPAVYWPQALKDGHPVNLRHLTDDPHPRVVSFTIDEEYGWVTASSASKGLLLGYLWRTEEYPWLNTWRHTENGKPLARGLEFGTTGVHQPFSVLTKKGRIFGRPIYSYLDAGEAVTRSYVAFLFKIRSDFRGVARVTHSNGTLSLQERGPDEGRELSIVVGELFPE